MLVGALDGTDVRGTPLRTRGSVDVVGGRGIGAGVYGEASRSRPHEVLAQSVGRVGKVRIGASAATVRAFAKVGATGRIAIVVAGDRASFEQDKTRARGIPVE